MAKFTENFITWESLAMAYRKVKADLYRSEVGFVTDLLLYEEKIDVNLKNLLERLTGDDKKWLKETSFLGGWTVTPTKIDTRAESLNETNNSSISSDPQQQWKAICRELSDKKPCAEFRLMAKPSIDFCVLSALWLAKVGHKFEGKLGACAYGNRMRRTRQGEYNEYSLGTSPPYFNAYRRWRDNGLSSIESALKENKKVIALTTDITNFYHELDPSFLLNNDFWIKIQVDLTEDERLLNAIFVRSLVLWAEQTPLKKGLPVGLPASGVIANIALYELDQIINAEIVPLYYGRYVDDIIMVIENTNGFDQVSTLWDWILRRTESIFNTPVIFMVR